MKFGVLILPETPWSTAQHTWKRAEDIGFDHAWIYDHLAWRSLRDSSWYAAIPTLTAAALSTQHIRLGTLVASPNFRHPLPFAKDLISLDDISDGRITLGIGAGSAGWDTTMLGQSPLTKSAKAHRFEEFVTLLDQLLRQTQYSWHGDFYTANEARTIPGCVQQPRIPFAIAATGSRGMTLAAKLGDYWVTTGDRSVEKPLNPIDGARVVQSQITQLQAICHEVGRNPSTIRRLVVTGPSLQSGLQSKQAFEDSIGRYAEIGITDFVIHWPRSEEPYAADVKIFESIMSQTLNPK